MLKKKSYNAEQIKGFWVGLMDGDGSIQVNHWRCKVLQYRMVIKLKAHPKNEEMLESIKKVIGGKVTFVFSKKQFKNPSFILWVENHQRNISKLLQILETYPPLSTRLQMQIAFVKACQKQEPGCRVSWMLKNRTEKYKFAKSLLQAENKVQLLSDLPYWKVWCSGFIEAEGCFCLRSNGSFSFSIGQKNDAYLCLALRDTFKGSNQIRLLKDNFYLWEVYRKSVLCSIIRHLENFPLLGEKVESFSVFADAYWTLHPRGTW